MSSSMWLLSLLFIYGFLPFLSCEECVKKLVECSDLRVQMQTMQFLPDTDEALETLCRVQGQYIECIYNVSQLCDEELASTIKLTFLSNEDFIKQFCKRGSNWWTNYLKSSRCINQQSLQSCVSPDHVEALKNKFEIQRRCSVANQIMACSATIILDKCGFEAENLFLSLVVFVTDYHFKCSLVGEIKDGKTASKTPTSPDVEDINKLNNLGMKTAVKRSGSEGKTQETEHANTEILRRSGENYDAVHKLSMFPAFAVKDRLQAHSVVKRATNAKFYDETAGIPLVTPATLTMERQETPQEEYLNESSDEPIYLDDTDSSSLKEADSPTGAHEIKYLENVRYYEDRPKETVIDLSRNFATRAMSYIRRILDPNLNIEAFKYPDETVLVYWEHPFVAPFKTLACRQADYIERYFSKSSTCIVYL